MFFSGTLTLQINRQAKAINERSNIIPAFTAKRDAGPKKIFGRKGNHFLEFCSNGQ
jgi:hypothetical protein